MNDSTVEVQGRVWTVREHFDGTWEILNPTGDVVHRYQSSTEVALHLLLHRELLRSCEENSQLKDGIIAAQRETIALMTPYFKCPKEPPCSPPPTA